MTRLEFMAECAGRTIIPELALEIEGMKDALKNRDDERVRYLLDTES